MSFVCDNAVATYSDADGIVRMTDRQTFIRRTLAHPQVLQPTALCTPALSEDLWTFFVARFALLP